MGLKFETVLTDGIAELSYLVGDDSAGIAAVVDPRPDCEIYLELARRHEVAITKIFETHIHADFMSGARELADRCGATIHCSAEGDAEYGFSQQPVADGDTFTFGETRLTARFTPGHTPEHLAYELAEQDREAPWGVLTGDSLFVDSAGRPDLLGAEETEGLAEQLFHTLRDYYLQLDDHVLIFPCHGAGSACGANIGDRPISSIGYERQFNEFLQYDDLDAFRRFVEEGAPPAPTHYPRLKKVNAAGPPVLGRLPQVPGLPPERFGELALRDDVTLVDTRHMLAFGGGHILGAINIGGRPELSPWGGWMLDCDRPILLVLDHDWDLDRIVRLLYRVGYTNFGGYLVGGMTAWDNQGLPLEHIPEVTVHELKSNKDEFQILDVRQDDEWNDGHIPGATHTFVGELRDGVAALELDPERPTVTYCATGYRASLASSLLQKHGFNKVHNLPGSWQAWTNAGLETSDD